MNKALDTQDACTHRACQANTTHMHAPRKKFDNTLARTEPEQLQVTGHGTAYTQFVSE